MSELKQTKLGGHVTFRAVIYGATFLSGAAGLIFQVVWQRYLSFLMGSEARSISLVVAVFLFGLATGYQFWGNMTERGWSRQKLLKDIPVGRFCEPEEFAHVVRFLASPLAGFITGEVIDLNGGLLMD